VDQAAKFEEIEIPLPEPLNGLDSIRAVVGIPEWWPTGARVAVAIAHDAGSDLNDPLVTAIHHHLALRKYLTIRFNFPFAENRVPANQDSVEVLERAFRAALSILGRDTTAAPSHLFLGGIGLGARVSARLAAEKLRIDGLFLLSYPLHPAGKPEAAQPDHLYRMVPPMLFVQGTEDKNCDLDALRRCLSKVGAPTTLSVIEGAPRGLESPPPPLPPPSLDLKASNSEDALPPEPVSQSVVADAVARWMDKVLSGR
jgi:predicted alpha/beta-hydrolase family hydrolase